MNIIRHWGMKAEEEMRAGKLKASAAKQDFGDLLKAARIKEGLAPESLSCQTRIPLFQIMALENSAHEKLPEDVYVKGFIKAYSSALDISFSEIVAVYAESRARYLKRLKSSKLPLDYKKTAVLIILTVVLAYFLNTALNDGRFIGRKAVDNSGMDTPISNRITVEHEEPEITDGIRLTLHARDQVVVKLIADGNFPEILTLKKDQTLDFSAKKNFNLLVENPKNVEIFFDDKPYALISSDQALNVFYP